MNRQAGSAVLLAALAGCAGAGLPGTTAPPLRGTTWLAQPAQAPEMSPPRPPELLLDASSERYSGFGGCNRIMGSYVLAGATLRLNAGGMTRMACPGSAGVEEMRFVQALERVQAWQQSGAELRLLDAAGQTVLLLRAGASAR